MRRINSAVAAASILLAAMIAGCASSPAVNKEASVSAIRAAEESGASSIPSASLYLELAREELDKAKTFAANNEKDQAESMLMRAQADGELAVALSHEDADKKQAADAIERVRKLRQENKIPQERN